MGSYRLQERIEACEETIVLDPPGQPELMQHHSSLPNILHRLEKLGYRVRPLSVPPTPHPMTILRDESECHIRRVAAD